MDYDVIVVGAGPAGSTTARWAAQGGARVLVLEKRRRIGVPVRCGEGISPGWLAEADIPLDDDWATNHVKGAKIYAPSGECLTVDDDNLGAEVGLVIERDRFDQALARLAMDAGAEYQLRATVTGLVINDGVVRGVRVRREGEGESDGEGERENEARELRCGIVAGADGFESQVGRWGGLSTHLKPADLCSALQYRMRGLHIDPDYVEFYLAKGSRGAYIWSFPKSAHESNVGIGVTVAQLHEPGETAAMLDEFIAEHPQFARGEIVERGGGGVSLSPPVEQSVAAGLMLVGDAARMIDSITGGGVANGCRAGVIAGRVAAEATAAGDFSREFLMRYDRSWREAMEEELYKSWVAKEKLTQVGIEIIDTIVATLNRVGVAKPSVESLLELLEEHHPELLAELADVL